MIRPARTYRGARSVAGPLLRLDRTLGAAAGEEVRIEAPGQPPRRGQVIDAGAEVSVIQILDDTLGLAPAEAAITLTGGVASARVGRDLLGRVLDGAGRPVDDLPPAIGEAVRPLWGAPINPARRLPPADFIETGVSAIDGLDTVVRGQKLPIFGAAGLPALELAARIVDGARARRGEPFAVIFAAIGATERETRGFLDRLRGGRALERSVLYLNGARDPAIERLLCPRLALAQAEFLAFEAGMHVLVVLADMAQYCETLREIASAREEVPGRRGYPGTMYSDLASLYERAGILAGQPGSLTQIPIVTMPDGDISHPIPDLTGYITEGQIVLSAELHRKGVFPPIDVLPSLSRLMKAGIGPGKTVPEHRRWADQLYAVYARGREARLMAAVVGEGGLGEADRRALAFADRFERELVHQGGARRTLADTIEIGWRLLESLPRSDLRRLDDATWAARAASRPGAAP
ncbi:MAG TPA: V-type ATP synthase subunit B [Kofleriaceae bacterium]|nr:V-type ATP synthase subunit B [Kofleriaceae bacterium]